ncbi:hypothetical protein WR30_00025 [Burkholderia contaminans FFH2055]|uniref:hypothetical protein n=1 Tax=Burkholderia contaminans TaxID=488447 RepID=UPI0006259E37|nr:hypothetical protein [Burkholderia contaminans]KKL36618.1 hypothetical protein WR30_00025 [Burkholderia contaminans FFH2055]MEB4635372.1 hypothetical protein [Burkholderia contaminans]MEB4642680.1 hypothetical protein [Burkholderia contaminans]MEB4657769.1 hypothetical protein [Burkholderia contaminans]MEB4665726.1 hypothetical protein [Burkholderia contaminans]
MALPTDTIGPFDVRTDDLMQIDAGQAVELFRQLLVIEAAKLGLPTTGVDVPASINVADGGIDADVTGVAGKSLPAGLIEEGKTCYQIKTGDFSASTLSDIRSLLIQPKFAPGKNLPTKDQLQPRVLSCFENGGAFVVVLFGTDLVGKTDDHGVKQISELMKAVDPAFAGVTVRIIRANQLCTAIKTLAPGIARRLSRVQGYDMTVFYDLSFMAEACELEIDSYQLTDELKTFAAEITRAADSLDGFKHVRILGDAGAGKTHLMYRALAACQLAGCVLYCPDPEQAMNSGPMEALRQMAPNTTIILVADDCDLDTSRELTALFRKRATKMLLVTANNLADGPSAHVDVQLIEMPRLLQPLLAEIFKGYGIVADEADWFASLCEGSPRAAHRLGQYIKHNPTQHSAEHFAHLDDLWNGIVCAPHSIDSVDGQDRLAVIRTMALFRQIAWETAEAPVVQVAILNAVKLLDPNFSQLRLVRAVEALRERRVLQGPRTLLISPKLLHVAMWKSWFEKYSIVIDVLKLRENLGERMQQHFDAMLMFAKESKAATAWADRLLGEGGMFASLASFATGSDASLFFAVAQAKPKAALRRFAAALEHKDVGARREFSGDARRTAINRLEQLAVPAETFFEATKCLLLLAEAENESWSNNATGTFLSLFNLGHGQLAASELSPIDKLDYLRELLRSPVPFYREIAVQALSKSLDPFMSRHAIDEVIGLQRLPGRWMPETWGQLYDAYAAHVSLLEESVDYLPHAEGLGAATGILEHFRSLVLIVPIAKSLLTFMRRAAQMPELRDKCIETIVATLHYEGKELSADVSSELQALRAELTESSFSTKLRRHAGMKLVEDHFNTDGEYVDGAKPELIQLAEAAVKDPALLLPELAWLVTDDAKNGYEFGVLLGRIDDLKLWSSILSAWSQATEKRSDFFIGGYLSAVHGTKVSLWEELVETLLSNNDIRQLALGVVWRSGISDRIAKLLLDLAKQGEIDPREFRLFIYGGVVNQLQLTVLEGVIDLLLGIDDPVAPDAALDLLESRLRGHPDEGVVLSRRIEQTLGAPAFIEGHEHQGYNNMLLYNWNEVANRLLELDADAAAHLAVRLIENFASHNSVTAGYRPDSLKFLSNVAQTKPEVVWPAIARRLESPRDRGTWHLLKWLRGGRSVRGVDLAGLNALPSPMVFEWVDVAPADRAWILAENCPPIISKPGETPSFARQVLERYAHIEQVRNSLHANSFTAAWSGPASEYYRGKLEEIEALLAIETNANVRMWLKERREQLQARVEHELERELREREY